MTSCCSGPGPSCGGSSAPRLIDVSNAADNDPEPTCPSVKSCHDGCCDDDVVETSSCDNAVAGGSCCGDCSDDGQEVKGCSDKASAPRPGLSTPTECCLDDGVERCDGKSPMCNYESRIPDMSIEECIRMVAAIECQNACKGRFSSRNTQK